MGALLPWVEPLREWQTDAYRAFLEHNGVNFLLVATPGSGKTLFSLRIAHYLLGTGNIERVVVVVPTDNLRRQWANKAGKVGIQLEPNWENSEFPEAADYHGMIVTYQQVGRQPRVSRYHCKKRPTLVIFDEIHHVGDQNSWGEAISYTFDSAKLRLGVSGTLFRTDNVAIPYVRYDGEGCSIPDFSYGYAEALTDGVCRPVFFPSYEGTLEWYSGGEIINASFKDDLDDDEAAHRLKTALAPDGNWIKEVIENADKKLTEIRHRGHTDAGGLIIATDQDHAKLIAEKVEEYTGHIPTLVISDVADASDKIDEFKNGKSRWLVAVRMVSEGVDIPRLRVCIYATTVRTELFFKQAVGRLVRVQEGIEEQSAHFYIPHEVALVSHAEKIKEERDHQLREERDRFEQGDYELAQRQMKIWMPIRSEAHADDVIFNAERFTQDDIELAKLIKARVDVSGMIEDAMVAQIVKAAKELGLTIGAKPKTTPTTVGRPLYDKKQGERTLVNQLVSRLHYQSGERLHFKDIHNMLIGVDNTLLSQCTLEQLNVRKKLLYKWLEEGFPDG